MIRFKHCINCMNITPPKDFVEKSIMQQLHMSERYLDGFADIIAGNDNVRVVMDRCEKMFLEKILSDYQTESYDGADEEEIHRGDGYFYDEDEDIDLDFDDDNVYYDGENIDRFLDWCLSRDENEKMEFEVNVDLFGMEGDGEE